MILAEDALTRSLAPGMRIAYPTHEGQVTARIEEITVTQYKVYHIGDIRERHLIRVTLDKIPSGDRHRGRRWLRKPANIIILSTGEPGMPVEAVAEPDYDKLMMYIKWNIRERGGNPGVLGA